LPGEVACGHAQALARLQQLQLELLLAQTEGVRDVEDAGVSGEPPLQGLGGSLELVEVAAAQLHLDGGADGDERGHEDELFRARDLADALAPQVGDVAGVVVAIPGVGEIELYLAEVRAAAGAAPSASGAALPAAAEGLLAHRREPMRDDRRRAFGPIGFDLSLESDGRGLDARHGGGGLRGRSSFGHGELGHHRIGLDGALEDEADEAASDEPRGDEQHGERDGHGEIAPLEGLPEQAPVGPLDEPLQAVCDAVDEASPAPRERVARWRVHVLVAAAHAVTQVGGQHEEGFHQGEEQAGDDHLGHHGAHRAHGTG